MKYQHFWLLKCYYNMYTAPPRGAVSAVDPAECRCDKIRIHAHRLTVSINPYSLHHADVLLFLMFSLQGNIKFIIFMNQIPPCAGGKRLVAAFIDKLDTNASLTIIALI